MLPLFDPAQAIADAVLFEDYPLYPRRADPDEAPGPGQSGVLTPRAFSAGHPDSAWWLEAQCPVVLGEPAQASAQLQGRLRFLHLQHRAVEDRASPDPPPGDPPAIPSALDVPALFDEGHPQAIDFACPLAPGSVELPFSLAESEDEQPLHDLKTGRELARVVRHRQALQGMIRVVIDPPAGTPPLLRLRVRVENLTAGAPATRTEALPLSLLGTHLLLGLSDAVFVSLTDPPPWARPAAAACRNTGTFPVLAGPPGQHHLLLCAPLILPDHPGLAAAASPDQGPDPAAVEQLLARRGVPLPD